MFRDIRGHLIAFSRRQSGLVTDPGHDQEGGDAKASARCNIGVESVSDHEWTDSPSSPNCLKEESGLRFPGNSIRPSTDSSCYCGH